MKLSELGLDLATMERILFIARLFKAQKMTVIDIIEGEDKFK